LAKNRVVSLSDEPPRTGVGCALSTPPSPLWGTDEYLTGHTSHRRVPQSAVRPLKIAIVHYWLVDRRGGERVVEALCELYPQADLFTNVYDPAPFVRTLGRHRVRTTFVNNLPFARQMLAQHVALLSPGATASDIPLLKLDVTSRQGSGQLSGVATILRLNTKGGVGEGPCERAGTFLSVPYSADYMFYGKKS